MARCKPAILDGACYVQRSRSKADSIYSPFACPEKAEPDFPLVARAVFNRNVADDGRRGQERACRVSLEGALADGRALSELSLGQAPIDALALDPLAQDAGDRGVRQTTSTGEKACERKPATRLATDIELKSLAIRLSPRSAD